MLNRERGLQPAASIDDALCVVQRCSGWRAALYVDATDGTSYAEVYTAYGAGHQVTLSVDEDGIATGLPPARALMSAWLKGRLGLWEFYGQSHGSMTWCLGLARERTVLSEGDRRTLGTRARYIGKLG